MTKYLVYWLKANPTLFKNKKGEPLVTLAFDWHSTPDEEAASAIYDARLKNENTVKCGIAKIIEEKENSLTFEEL